MWTTFLHIWTMIVTGMLVLFFAQRILNKYRGITFSELFVVLLYLFAARAVSLAEATDSFVIAYREIKCGCNKQSRARLQRMLVQDKLDSRRSSGRAIAVQAGKYS